MTSKALLYLLITLLVGIGLGMITDRALLTIGRKPVMERRPPERNIIDNIVRDFELSPQQVDSIRPVLEDFFRRADSTRALVMKHARADMDSLRLNLLPFLTQGQIKKMNEMGLFRPGTPGPGGPLPPPPGEGPCPDGDPHPGRHRPGDVPPRK
jgi:hypothetical protein